jgi:hypothetical protein
LKPTGRQQQQSDLLAPGTTQWYEWLCDLSNQITTLGSDGAEFNPGTRREEYFQLRGEAQLLDLIQACHTLYVAAQSHAFGTKGHASYCPAISDEAHVNTFFVYRASGSVVARSGIRRHMR